MKSDDFVTTAVLLDGRGGGARLSEADLRAWTPEQGVLWVHAAHGDAAAEDWLSRSSGLEDIVLDSLQQSDTRPRCAATGDGLIIALRGVNVNPGAEPDDMVALRMWVDATRVVTVRRRRLHVAAGILDALERGRGPRTCGELVAEIADALVAGLAEVMEALEDQMDAVDEEVVIADSHEIRPRLADLRRQVISLRRYLAPQREALERLRQERTAWSTAEDGLRLRETTDRLVRHLEELDSIRDRAGVTAEELMSRLSERMERRMYALSIVAVVFLPLGFLTGLLGINVGGIPGAEFTWSFAIVCAVLVVVTALELWYFRRKRWM